MIEAVGTEVVSQGRVDEQRRGSEPKLHGMPATQEPGSREGCDGATEAIVGPQVIWLLWAQVSSPVCMNTLSAEADKRAGVWEVWGQPGQVHDELAGARAPARGGDLAASNPGGSYTREVAKGQEKCPIFLSFHFQFPAFGQTHRKPVGKVSILSTGQVREG